MAIKIDEYKRIKKDSNYNNRLSKIYAIVDPLSNNIFYIGCSKRPLHIRYMEHINGHMCQSGRDKQRTIDNMVNEGREPLIEVLYSFKDDVNAKLIEKFIINFTSLYSFRCNLKNTINTNLISE